MRNRMLKHRITLAVSAKLFIRSITLRIKGKFVFIQATLIKSNLNQIWDIAKLICKYPNTKLKITPFTNPGAKVIYDKNEIVGKELYNAFLTTIDELKAEYKGVD